MEPGIPELKCSPRSSAARRTLAGEGACVPGCGSSGAEARTLARAIPPTFVFRRIFQAVFLEGDGEVGDAMPIHWRFSFWTAAMVVPAAAEWIENNVAL